MAASTTITKTRRDMDPALDGFMKLIERSDLPKGAYFIGDFTREFVCHMPNGHSLSIQMRAPRTFSIRMVDVSEKRFYISGVNESEPERAIEAFDAAIARMKRIASSSTDDHAITDASAGAGSAGMGAGAGAGAGSTGDGKESV